MKEFKVSNWVVSNNKSAAGTSLQGYFTENYGELVKLLGEPAKFESFDGKISTMWTLTLGRETVTLYDYKETSNYDPSYPPVEQFRAQKEYDWHIGAMSKVSAEHFAEWLRQKLSTSAEA